MWEWPGEKALQYQEGQMLYKRFAKSSSVGDIRILLNVNDPK